MFCLKGQCDGVLIGFVACVAGVNGEGEQERAAQAVGFRSQMCLIYL